LLGLAGVLTWFSWVAWLVYLPGLTELVKWCGLVWNDLCCVAVA
jgi:hypothetical protein